MTTPWRFLLSAALACTLALLGGCGDDDDKVLGPGGDDEPDMNAWVWVLDDQTGAIWVHDADTGDLKATLSGASHPMMRQALAGPDAEPTAWMGKEGSAHAFTRGFHPHGDHAHMEIPEGLGTVPTGPGNVHQGVDDHGDHVTYANDGDQTFTVIDAETRTPRTVHHGSGHSAAFYSHGLLVATDMHNKWARGIDVDADSIVFEVGIDTLAHGHAFHHASETLFLATLNGFEVLDLESETLGARIPYPVSGRVNFLYHAQDVPVAFGPHKTGGATSSIILLNMEQKSAEALTIDGASLAWSISGGNFALSESGAMAAATDLDRARAYLICIDAGNASCYKTVLTLEVPAANMACALNYSGDHLWVLDKSDGKVYCYHPDEGELHNSWQAEEGADYIFVTSLPEGIEVVKDF